jgi:hypothetical protein
MTAFWDFIKDLPAEEGRLPLVHTTDIWRATNELRTQPCPVYEGERLLYFFYGRPAYRGHRTVETTTAKALAPVCLIINNRLSETICRILPFDSGAFHNGLMHPPMHPDLSLSDYELGINANAPMKLIKAFFGTEKNYFDRMPNHAAMSEDEAWQNLSVDSFFQLIRSRSNSRLDDRICAIEIQIKDDLVLHNAVEAVILPSAYLEISSPRRSGGLTGGGWPLG